MAKPLKSNNKFLVPRLWSNQELRKFSSLFKGKVVNVSAAQDGDKQGQCYRDYFHHASEYWITNWGAGKKGLQGWPNELPLDLEAELRPEWQGRFDVAFNHTTLEHIYECRKAFKNLCSISRDVVIVVVPYIQQLHGLDYADYWRFTPYTLKRMYEENGLKLRYCSANGADAASIYIFALGYRDPVWDAQIPERFDLKLNAEKDLYADGYTNVIGGFVVP